MPEDFPVSPLQVRMFGPFDVQVEGRPLPRLRSRKHQWLLALLALRPNREVQRTWLAGNLWTESADAAAFNSLRQGLVDVRRALGPQAYRLESPTRHTLCLNLSGVDVDVFAFDSALQWGHTGSLERAVALYRGPLLEGCLEDWVVAERFTREQAYLDALQTLSTHARARHDLPTAIGYLRKILAIDPIRETALRNLMQALADAGEWAEAFAVYQELRRHLRNELNVSPDADTTALYQKLQVQGRSLTVRAAPPLPLPTSSPCPRSRLPHPLTSMIGREEAVTEVVEMLATSRLVTLTGAGGVGKTRLAIAVGGQAEDDYADGVWLVELASLSDPLLVPQTVAKTLGVSEQSSRPFLETLMEALSSRSSLLILDNAEHLLEACASLADRLLASCAELRMLITSRQWLGIVGERTYRVPSLLLPPQDLSKTANKVAAIREYAGIRLFVERAKMVEPTFLLTEENVSAVMRICRRLDGIPLAIEMAAVWMRLLSVEEINRKLDDRFRLLTQGSRTALARHRTLRALIDWSYDLLTAPEQTLLCRMAVFTGGWTLEAAERVCCGEGIEECEVFDTLTSLVDKSLVVIEPQKRQTRYHLLETVREYAWERLRECRELERVRERHQESFLSLAEEAESYLEGREQGEWLQRLEVEHENLREALNWSLLEQDASEVSLRFCGSLCLFWWRRGHLAEGRRWCEQALGKANPLERTLARAKVLSGVASLHYLQGDYTSARNLYEQSLLLFQECGDQRGLAHAWIGLGNVIANLGDFIGALTVYDQSRILCGEIGERRGLARALSCLGSVAIGRADFVSAMCWYQKSILLFREIGDQGNLANSLTCMGQVISEQGDFGAAHPYFKESLTICRDIGDRSGIAHSLISLGHVAHAKGDLRAAQRCYEEGLAICQEIGHRGGIAISLEACARLAARESKSDVE